MKKRIKLFLRKKTLMALRALLWHADEWLHAAELKLRQDLAAGVVPVKQSPALVNGLRESNLIPAAAYGRSEMFGSAGRRRVSFQEWEARKSGVAVISKKEARRRRSGAEFDLRFAR